MPLFRAAAGTDVAASTTAAAPKPIPVDADYFPIVDTAAANILKKLTFTNLKSFLNTFFNGIYQPIGPYLINGGPLATPSSGDLSSCTGSPNLDSPQVAVRLILNQPTQTTKAAAATLTAAELLTGIIQYTGAAANLTLPLASNLDVAISGLAADRSIEFVLINTGSGTATLLTNTGWTLVGSMALATTDKAATFRARKTGAGVWTLYRIAG